MQATKKIAIEAGLVFGAGVVVALAANALSPRGLTLTRDYFPSSTAAVTTTANAGRAASTAASVSRVQSPLERLKEKGLQAATHDDVVRWHREPGYVDGRFVFVDARNEQRYGSGHIPGAYSFNYYRAEETLAALLPVCFAAEKVVVYCSGGECDDSEFAALLLQNAGVPAGNVFVYVEGVAGWKAAGLSLETGQQHSGVLIKP